MGDIVLAVLCVLVLAVLVWWLFGRLLRPLPGTSIRVLIPGRGDGNGLEQAVRGLIWLRSLGLLRCPVVIGDIDLTPEGWELALRLTARWPDIILWPIEDLPDYLAGSD
jgi:hypothetical protein